MKEVLIVTRFGKKGNNGVFSHFKLFSEYLNKKKIENRILTPYDYYPILIWPVFALRLFIAKIFKSLNFPLYIIVRTYFLKKCLQKEFKKDEDKVVYAQCPFSANAALRARKSQKTTVCMVVHFNTSHAEELILNETLSRKNKRIIRFIEAEEEKAFIGCDKIVFVSAFMKKIMEQRVPEIKKKSVKIISNPVEPSIRKNTKMTGDIINIGTLIPIKNQLYLVEIMKELRKKGKNYSLTIVGEGPERTVIEKTIEKNNLSKNITLTGLVEKGKTLIPQHKIYCHTAILENQGIVLLEALSYGVPILAPKKGGMVDMVKEGKNGYFIPLDDPKAAAKTIIKVIENKEQYKKMSKYAKDQFNKYHSSEIVCKKLYEFLQ